MPPKKAAKKAAKKSAKHHEEKESREMRRAYEHLGRVEILQRSFGGGSESSPFLGLGQRAAEEGAWKDAAELLRASEHFLFAKILEQEKQGAGRISSRLAIAIEEEFARLEEKAEEQWDEEKHHELFAESYRRSRKEARKALKEKNYRRAMELIRVAEALTHVESGQRKGAPARSAISAGDHLHLSPRA